MIGAMTTPTQQPGARRRPGGAPTRAAPGRSREVAEEFGVTHRTVRHYEDLGLISPERRGTSRVYHRRDRTRLGLILRGKRLGFPLEEIRTIIDLYDAPRGQGAASSSTSSARSTSAAPTSSSGAATSRTPWPSSASSSGAAARTSTGSPERAPPGAAGARPRQRAALPTRG